MKITITNGIWNIIDHNQPIYYEIIKDEKEEFHCGSLLHLNEEQWSQKLKQKVVKIHHVLRYDCLSCFYFTVGDNLVIYDIVMIYDPFTDDYIASLSKDVEKILLGLFQKFKQYINEQLFEMKIKKIVNNLVNNLVNEKIKNMGNNKRNSISTLIGFDNPAETSDDIASAPPNYEDSLEGSIDFLESTDSREEETIVKIHMK